MFVRQIVDPAGDRQVRVHFIFRCDVHEAVIFDVEVWVAEVSGLAYLSNSSSPARLVALTTALMSVTRSFPSSSSRMPSMVQPAGVVTASLAARDDRRFPI